MHKFNAHAGVLTSLALKHYTVFHPRSCASCKIQPRLPANKAPKGHPVQQVFTFRAVSKLLAKVTATSASSPAIVVHYAYSEKGLTTNLR